MANQPLPLTPPKGMRDFGPEEMRKRQFIFDQLRSVFLTFGYEGIETPSMERLNVLTGKYGQEGDRLIFKVLNSGDFMKPVNESQALSLESKDVVGLISEKALRYDLTIPFARYVSANRGTLSFPFKRHQIQPVWRADQPQKGRYREFYQCDVDVVGSTSLWQEVELIRIFAEGFTALGIQGIEIQINHRSLLIGLVEFLGFSEQTGAIIGILDKSDKISLEQQMELFRREGFTSEHLEKIEPILNWSKGGLPEHLTGSMLEQNHVAQGVRELSWVIEKCLNLGALPGGAKLLFNPKLARGLDYYTGCIFEVVIPESGLGSVGGGGRYDNLTDMFGVPNLSGVGISFGAERIYDFLQHSNLWPKEIKSGLDYFFLNFDDSGAEIAMQFMAKFRAIGARCDMYPEAAKIQKQMKYANQRQASYVVSIGEREIEKQEVGLKNMESGEQINLAWDKLIAHYEHQS